jgi:hypothetical protein
VSRTYDIHLASDVISPWLEECLANVGFRRDEFLGGTTGVVHPCHYSLRPNSHEAFIRTWKEALSILSRASQSDFFGYAEAEITPTRFRTELPFKPFNPMVPFPFSKLEHMPCPSSKYKDLDIHLTVDLSSIDPRLKHTLEEEINFNYVDIRKPSGNIVRVYTFQPCGIRTIVGLYKNLLTYLLMACGLEGKIKLEATYGFARFPHCAVVPPIVTTQPPLQTSWQTYLRAGPDLCHF